MVTKRALCEYNFEPREFKNTMLPTNEDVNDSQTQAAELHRI